MTLIDPKLAAERAGRWGVRGTAAATIAARLAFERVSHDYDGVPSVLDVSLTVEPGEVLCLLGHSGCGKTTLLRLAAGIERQSAGRVLINEREVGGPSRFLPPEKRGIGLMFQDYALFPHLSIIDNVMFGLRAMARDDARREALSALSRVGLGGYAEDYPHALSGGEQQRVALARAIAPRPGVLLMDEPFSGLDRRLRDSVRDETLSVLRETRATCILVTHDPEEAMRMGDRIALMRKGAITQLGTADELYNRPADLFVARFFSELNEIEGVAGEGDVETVFGRYSAPGVKAGDKIDVSLRPQGIILGEPGEGRAGRVVRRRFVGEVDLIDLAVEGLDHEIKARIRDGGRFAVGMDVGIRVDERDVLVFKRDES
ncbi:ATP-binding cassette domain-containing protein [Stappia sp. GBMRC 2046]|uniref:ATP-binding cassette domain-containing protein n=1 Tax=Stappia sediminis TaxID=2692190 RepID=A0A7X3LT05_9HYPH|nr:ABC transporter ATP-binding protein [Stappia sediminis]MXN64564.1 ATP-binding cassette domain-containing protein [Stappia sediminis]